MSALHAAAALLPEGWRRDVRVTLDGPRLASVEADTPAGPGDERHAVLVPAMPNLHSHAFQRAMAGLAETRGPADDTFWSWRAAMYRFVGRLNPDHVEAVAALLYVEMLEAGFGRVGEFHYLHHDPAGRPYDNPAELAERVAAASRTAGIGLTLLPVFYAHAGCGGRPPVDGQRRFVSSLDGFAGLAERSRALAAGLEGGRFGLAPHSLRAVTPDELAAILPLAAGGPVHIHAAEQTGEVAECLAWSGARPVQWLLDHAPVDARWCIVHATHMTEDETRRLAATGAVAGLCPVTEANLGDGTGPVPLFLASGGRLGIGSDSNILIGVADELRQLDYAQRLHARARNVLAPPGGSTGRAVFDAALAGGAAALAGRPGLAPGNDADLVALDQSSAPFLDGDAILDGWIFARTVRVESVWAGGRRVVDGGRHRARADVERRFLAAMADLLSG